MCTAYSTLYGYYTYLDRSLRSKMTELRKNQTCLWAREPLLYFMLLLFN